MSADAPGFFVGKRLVVFGAGYVGGRVVDQALQRGMKVTALTRNPATAAVLARQGAEVVVDDLARSSWHPRIVPGADFVLNAVSSGGGGAAGYRHSYIDGMRSILAWAAHEPAGAVVYTSSTSVYPQSGGALVTENDSTEGSSETASLLIEAEALLREAPGVAKSRTVLRLAGIYGPGRHHVLDQLRSGVEELGGRGEHTLNLIHRDDIADAVWSAFATSPAVPFDVLNVADGSPVPKAELVEWLCGRLGRAIPHFSGGTVGARRANVPDRVISNAKIKQVLGWRPRVPDFKAGYAPLLEA